MMVVWLLVAMHAVICIGASENTGNEPKAVTLGDFTPEKGYKPKESGWTKIVVKNRVTVNVAEFIKTLFYNTEYSKEKCVRVVHFSGELGPLDAVEVPCDDSPLHTGLVLHDEEYLTYYSSVYVEWVEHNSRYSWKQDFIISLSDYLLTCNYVSIKREKSGIYRREKRWMDKEYQYDPLCDNLIEGNISPMSLLSYRDKRSIDTSNLLVSYNYGKTLGARIYEFKEDLICYRQLRFYSFDLDLDLALTMTCGHVTDVAMTERAFYSKDVTIQPQDGEENTFTLFINPSGLVELFKEGDESPKCIKTTFTVTKDGDRYVKKIKNTGFAQQSAECNEFVDGNFVGKFENIEENEVRREFHEELDEYSFNHRDEYNLANELGIVVFYYGFQYHPNFSKVILLLARGIVLTKHYLGYKPEEVDLEISGDELYCNGVIMVKKSEDDKFTVILKTNSNECSKQTYEVKGSGEKKKNQVGNELTVSDTDPDCESLLKRKPVNIQENENP